MPLYFYYRLQLPKEKRLTPLQARVTSLLLQQQPSSTLWLGLGSGHLLLVNATTRIPLMAVKRQLSAVRGLLSVRALVGEKPAHLILSGGFGFQQRPITSSQANGGRWIQKNICMCMFTKKRTSTLQHPLMRCKSSKEVRN